jgi:hypothetical protein
MIFSLLKISKHPRRLDLALHHFELIQIRPLELTPIDLPLVKRGEKVRVWFDGWPTIVFSGWPDMSYGTFGGKIVAVENFISDNGKFRVYCLYQVRGLRI